MNFEFSDEQVPLCNQARRFLETKFSSKSVHAIFEDSAPIDRTRWTGRAEMGFLGTAIPDQFGGLGAYFSKLAAGEAIGSFAFAEGAGTTTLRSQ